MKREIAMRCTQEQFDSIKDRINLPINDSMFDLKQYPYLANNFFYDNCQGLGTLPKSFIKKETEIHETFNADIFLEACGEEVEKVWKGSDLEMRYSIDTDWFDVYKDYEFRLKPQPNYSQEIEALQQKAKENGMKAVITFEKL
jgi:hypothetical protein